MLLERQALAAHYAIEHLVGLQAQVPTSPYYSLWARLANFAHDDLARLIVDRKAVRIALMRSTIHLVTASDCLEIRPLIRSVLERELFRNATFGPGIAGMDVAELVAAGRALLDRRPLTTAELGKLLKEQWPERDASSLAYAMRNLAPLIQVPPRGVWGASARTAYATVETWLRQPLAPDPSIDDLITRYLAVFGPATVADIQAWSRLTGLGEVVERLRPRLRTFHDERGRELFDVPDAEFPDPETPAPPRFLPDYDNALLAHANRSRIIPLEHRDRSVIGRPTVLVDGFVRGTWSIRQQRGMTPVLQIQLFEALSPSDRAGVADEGARLLAFAVGNAAGDVEFFQIT
jgi:hypothetical protein